MPMHRYYLKDKKVVDPKEKDDDTMELLLHIMIDNMNETSKDEDNIEVCAELKTLIDFVVNHTYEDC